MKILNKILLTSLITAGSFGIFGKGYGQDKYQDFADLVINEGERNIAGKPTLKFLKNNKNYTIQVDQLKTKIWIFVDYQNISEFFFDEGLDGLDNYRRYYNGYKTKDYFGQDEKENYEMLINSIPRW